MAFLTLIFLIGVKALEKKYSSDFRIPKPEARNPMILVSTSDFGLIVSLFVVVVLFSPLWPGCFGRVLSSRGHLTVESTIWSHLKCLCMCGCVIIIHQSLFVSFWMYVSLQHSYLRIDGRTSASCYSNNSLRQIRATVLRNWSWNPKWIWITHFSLSVCVCVNAQTSDSLPLPDRPPWGRNALWMPPCHHQ